MSGGGAESRADPIQAMVGAARSGYPGDKSGACSRGKGMGGWGWRNRRERGSRVGKDGRRETKMTRRIRDDRMEI